MAHTLKESYTTPTPTGGSAPTKNVKIIDVPDVNIINQIINGVLGFFTGEFNILDFVGRVAAVLFESIVYDFKEDIPIDSADFDRVQKNISFNVDRGFTNIEFEFLGLIEGYHTWKLFGYNADGNYRVWYIQGYNEYQTSQAVIEETVDEVIASINRIDWTDWTFGPAPDVGGISRLDLIDKVTAQAKEHGLL